MKDFNHYYQLLIDELNKWAELMIAGLPDAVLALLVFVAFLILSVIAKKVSYNVLSRFSDAQTLNRLMSSVAKAIVIVIGFAVSLGILGLQKAVFSVLAGAGVVGLAIGFAFQDLAANFIAGVFMAFRRPFNTGDVIETDGHMGTVHQLNMRNTIIKTFDGQLLIIPNKTVFENPLTNFSVTGSRRIHLVVGVGYESDLQKTTTEIKNAINTFDFIDKEKGVNVIANSFGDSAINFDVYYWIAFPDGDVGFLDAIHQGILEIKKTLDEAGINIPFPIRTLDIPESISLNKESS